VAACLAVCEANGCQFEEIAKHGEEVPGVDSIAARLWGRFFFHLQLAILKARCADFLIPDGVERHRCQSECGGLVKSKCQCLLRPRLRPRLSPSISL
jgi:hypothetical protein